MAAIKRHGRPVSAVAAGAGVSYEQLKKVMQREGASTNVDDARRVAAYFGLTLDEFFDDNLAEDRLQAAMLWLELTEPEREIVRDAARGRAAQGQKASQ